jgi:hypothetical protein
MRRNDPERWYDTWWLEDLAVRMSDTTKLARQSSWCIKWQPWCGMLPGGYADIFLKKNVYNHTVSGKWEIMKGSQECS